MAARMTTERSEVVAKATEYADGTPWIYFEPSNGDQGIPAHGTFGLDLHEGVTFEEAERLSAQLQMMVRSIVFMQYREGS